MIINEIKYFSKELTFKTPFKTSQATYTKKKILIVELRDELNNSALGECAPLPEFGTENFEHAEEKLIELQKEPSLIDCRGISDDNGNIEKRFGELSNFPALRFAFEQALFTLISKREKEFFLNLFETNYKNAIDINGIIGFGDLDEIIEKTNLLLREGFKTIKLKCGRKNFEEDFKILKEVKNHLGNKINLRIDINGKWNFEDAKTNLTRLNDFNLEYAEQPVNNNKELVELSKIVKIKIAADESVKSLKDAKHLLEAGIRFLVIKPTVVGGILNTIKIIAEAVENNANIIISSSFESNIGKSVLVYLASLTSHDFAHGLGVENLFEQNICDTLYPAKKGKINFDINNYPPEINF